MKCSECKFWDRLDVYQDIGDGYFIFMGFCHRYPPMIPVKEQRDDEVNASYVETYQDAWCGEFKRRVKK